MDYIILTGLFLLSGLGAVAFYMLVPSRQALKEYLPNTPNIFSLVAALFLAGIIYYVIHEYESIRQFRSLQLIIFSMLLFESWLLVMLRLWKRTDYALMSSVVLTIGVVALFRQEPSFILFNSIIIVATYGAAALLIRMHYLRTGFVFLVAILWSIYDILLVSFLLPNFTRETNTPFPSFAFPAVTIGGASLGAGDFMFLAIFTMIMVRRFGPRAAITLVLAEALTLLIVALALAAGGVIVPFLVAMTPVFFVVYGIWYWHSQRAHA